MPLIVATNVCHAARLQRRTGSARTSLGPKYKYKSVPMKLFTIPWKFVLQIHANLKLRGQIKSNLQKSNTEVDIDTFNTGDMTDLDYDGEGSGLELVHISNVIDYLGKWWLQNQISIELWNSSR